jgi:dynein light chain roadblock-type
MASKESTNLQELEETVSRLSGHKGVEAVLMLNREGNILVVSGGASKEDPAATAKQAKFIKQLMDAATKLIHCLDPNDSVSFVHLRSKQHQVMLAPHNDYVLAVLQDPLVSSATLL